MAPTYEVGDELDVDTGAYGGSEPVVGDVVVVNPPSGADFDECGTRPKRGEACAKPTQGAADVEFLERVVAGPGDEIAFEKGAAVVNGEALEEDFAEPCSEELCDLPKPVTVPDGHWFLAGDNRGAASDSRVWGPVPLDSFVGQVSG
jgi:signal peptidase I